MSYGWARFTPPVRFTGSLNYLFGVFRVGQGTDRKFMFMEAHYHHASTTPDDKSGITIHMTRHLNTNSTTNYDGKIKDIQIHPIFPTVGVGPIAV